MLVAFLFNLIIREIFLTQKIYLFYMKRDFTATQRQDRQKGNEIQLRKQLEDHKKDIV